MLKFAPALVQPTQVIGIVAKAHPHVRQRLTIKRQERGMSQARVLKGGFLFCERQCIRMWRAEPWKVCRRAV